MPFSLIKIRSHLFGKPVLVCRTLEKASTLVQLHIRFKAQRKKKEKKIHERKHPKHVFLKIQSAQPYYVSFSLANEERINFLASSALFPRSFHALSTIISRLSHATNPTATRNVKFACHSIVPRSPRATGKIASRYTLQPIATCLHFILDQYRIRSSDPNVFTRVR